MSAKIEAVSIALPEIRPVAPVGDDHPCRPWIIAPWLLRNAVTLLHAAGGVGKSTFVMHIAVKLATGCAWAVWPEYKPLRVLYVCSEDDFDEIQRRFAAICADMKVKQPTTLHNMAAVPVAALHPEDRIVKETPYYGQYIAAIKKGGYDVVIWDPLIEMSGGIVENDNGQMDTVVKTIRSISRQTNTAALVVHHNRKGGKSGDAESARGGGSLMAGVRCAIDLNFVDGDPNGRVLNGTKSNYGPKTGELHFKFASVRLANGDGVGVMRYASADQQAGSIDSALVIRSVKKRYDEGEAYFESDHCRKTRRLSKWIAKQFEVTEGVAKDWIDDALARGLIEKIKTPKANDSASFTYPINVGLNGQDQLLPEDDDECIPF